MGREGGIKRYNGDVGRKGIVPDQEPVRLLLSEASWQILGGRAQPRQYFRNGIGGGRQFGDECARGCEGLADT